MTWLPSNMPTEVYTPYSLAEALGLFIGIPLLFFIIVFVLVSAPGWTRAGRHRPGQGWDADPLWVEGGGSAAARGALPASETPEGEATDADRGSSGRW